MPRSHNAIDPGQNSKVHGTNPDNDHMDRVDRTAPYPDVPQGGLHSGQGAPGKQSGEGGHDPKTLGEKKGLGSLRGTGV